MQLKQRRDDDKGDTEQNVDDTLHDKIHAAAIVSFNRAVNGADQKIDDRNPECKQERQPYTGSEPYHDILSDRICAE